MQQHTLSLAEEAKVVAPNAGEFTLTFVGTGASTAIPVLGHINQSCACADALRHWDGKNVRNNVSLLLTLPIAVEGSTRENNKATTVTSTTEKSKCEESQSNTSNFSGKDDAPVEHDNFALAEVNCLHGVRVKHILIDAGKTFRDAYFRVLMKHKVQLLDALLLTHDHADAIAGLDDLRDLQRMKMNLDDGHWYISYYIPTYMTTSTLHTLKSKVDYVMKNSQIVGDAACDTTAHARQMKEYYTRKEAEAKENHLAVNDIGIRRTTALQVFTLPEHAPTQFYVSGLEHIMHSSSSTSHVENNTESNEYLFYSLPVEHGTNYISLGFVFGTGVAFRSAHVSESSVIGKSCVVYISDVSTIIEPSMSFLRDLVKIDVLIIDCIHRSGKHSLIHFCADDVIKLAVALRPKHVYTVGMYCDIEQEQGEEELKKLLRNAELQQNDTNTSSLNQIEGIHVAFDGLSLLLPL